MLRAESDGWIAMEESILEQALQVTFRGLDATDALRKTIEEKARNLDRFYSKIESCRVVVDSPGARHQKGGVFQVKVRLKVPGDEIVVSREPSKLGPHGDLYLAINDAFKEVKRQLESYVRRRRRQVKRHEGPEQARVVRLFPSEGYGFLETEEGREIYFHENSVLNGGFRALSVGALVRFAEETGEKGPQASTVSVVATSGAE
jgi:ribosomal subunit interface protein